MNTSVKLVVKDIFSKYLALRYSADRLFDQINSSPEKKVIVDFIGITSISRSFAHEYFLKKKESSKIITEKNMSQNVEKMFLLVSHPVSKIKFLKDKSLDAVEI